MSVLSDRQIRLLSLPPTAVVTRVITEPKFVPGERTQLVQREVLEFSHLSIEDLKRCVEQFAWLGPVPGIDIRAYRELTDDDRAAWKPMIEPFEPAQVRFEAMGIEDCDKPGVAQVTRLGNSAFQKKVISYGTSSFGYDVRCADQFKVFTNVHSTIVDPKNFDDKSFVDFQGDGYCIIPPNSFALARTLEYFRIPRNVLTVCVGKSTYARCFTGDTKVALVDGSSASFEELVSRSEKGERFWGYSTDIDGRIQVSELTAPRKVGCESVIEIVLDNDEIIRCTPDHKFLTRAGKYVEAQYLTPDQSLMALYRGEYRGYESVYQPVAGMMMSTHWLSDLYNLRTGVYPEMEDSHRHHQDHNRRNNKPTNLIRMSEDEHAKLHNEERWSHEEARLIHGGKISEALAHLSEDEEWYKYYCSIQRIRARAFWIDPSYAAVRAQLLEQRKFVSEETRAKQSDTRRRYYESQEIRDAHGLKMKTAWLDDYQRRDNQRKVARKINLREEITEAVVKAALSITGTIRGAARYLQCDRSVFRRFPEILSEFYGTPVANNHKVREVRKVFGVHDVYCLTVPEFGNFALESGVFVKNCGIIVNVTPFEPEWEGYVTLEFSNTTPLPAKIYANEGVAQVLFFCASEPCEVSYKDRGGKYQGQTGITTPRA